MWSPKNDDLKLYRHFDHAVPLRRILPFVSNPANVTAHKFMPLIHFEKKWRRAPKTENGSIVKRPPKIREIRYPCRKDSYIFKYYREILASKYEARLEAHGISDCVLAYRHIPKRPDTDSCKSNIEFAKEAFEAVESLGNCCVVAIDISDFFGSMDHARIKSIWKELLDIDRLPDDHFAVYKALTQFRYVVRDDAYIALGYSERDSNGTLKFLRHPDDIPLQICSNEKFRELIVGGGLIKKHDKDHGVPQGCPLSDLIANAYLFDFDLLMASYARTKGGFYFRYSDDILFVLPGDGRSALAAFKKASHSIRMMGPKIFIKPEKTEITLFRNKNGSLAPAL